MYIRYIQNDRHNCTGIHEAVSPQVFQLPEKTIILL